MAPSKMGLATGSRQTNRQAWLRENALGGRNSAHFPGHEHSRPDSPAKRHDAAGQRFINR